MSCRLPPRNPLIRFAGKGFLRDSRPRAPSHFSGNFFSKARLAGAAPASSTLRWPRASQWRTIMTKGMFALLLAGALMVPHVTPALGTDSTDSTLGLGPAQSPQANGGDLQLPPIPHLDTLRWLDTGVRGPKADTLMGPKLDMLGPFLLEPEIPSASLAGGPGWGRC